MSSRSKGKKKSSQKNFGDVTINDFANATVWKNRAKKSSAVDERSWDEKVDDYDDFDFIEEENEDGSKSMIIKKRRHRKLTETEKKCDCGVEYPLDIWFLISEYIRPEDVGKFALICRGSWSVTYSGKFWFGLYRRYYRGVTGLPERLQPESMVRLYGLRACVIRALHHFYSPFIEGAKSILRTFPEHPSALVKRICVTAWHERITKTTWIYRWKLREASEIHPHPSTKNNQPDLLEMLDDVSANAEHGCRILQLICPSFIAMPPVMGLRLINAKVSLSQGFSSHCVTLKFTTGVNASVDNNIDIVLDPVINVCVLDWWHPKYPHPVLNTPFLDTGLE